MEKTYFTENSWIQYLDNLNKKTCFRGGRSNKSECKNRKKNSSFFVDDHLASSLVGHVSGMSVVNEL